jgi:hypothetical protein
MKNFFYEWRKLLLCVTIVIILSLLQHFFKTDFSDTIKDLISYCKVLLGAAALRYSVLSTSERKELNKDVKEDDDNYLVPPPGISGRNRIR